jgi:hypothetical protein
VAKVPRIRLLVRLNVLILMGSIAAGCIAAAPPRGTAEAAAVAELNTFAIEELPRGSARVDAATATEATAAEVTDDNVVAAAELNTFGIEELPSAGNADAAALAVAATAAVVCAAAAVAAALAKMVSV